MLKGEKGITMLALVITVILLCLLASITISFSIGEEGVFTKSRRINYLDDISELQKELSEKEVLARANGQDNNTIKKELEEYLNNWLNSNEDYKDYKFEKEFQDIINKKKPIIMYYGALAKWFDYDLIKKIAKTNKYSVVLFGIKLYTLNPAHII